MFNPKKPKRPEEKLINRLSSLRREDETVNEEINPSSQNNKSGAAFSKALNAVRKEVGEEAPSINNKSSKTVNRFIKGNDQPQSKAK